jgi:hypothetical protein
MHSALRVLEKISVLASTIAAIIFGSLLQIAVADQPPKLNIRPTCTGVPRESVQSASSAQCEKSEQEARNTLDSEWSKFSAVDRRECLALTRIGGFPSYVQVLTCLEIARDARGRPSG